MSIRRSGTSLGLLGAIALLVSSTVAGAAVPAAVGLGTATSYAVLAGAGITNTGPSVINGDVGTCPTPAMTGFAAVTVNGAVHANDEAACQAQADLTTAYNDAAGRAPNTTFPGPTDLGGMTLVSGVYRSPSSLALTGALTLDGQGDTSAVFIFQAGSTLITEVNSNVVFANGAQACNVFWQVGSSATLGVGSNFAGSILALTDITANTNAVINGRLLARNGAVTLDTNTITRPTCATPTTSSTTADATTTSTTGATGGSSTSTSVVGGSTSTTTGGGATTSTTSASDATTSTTSALGAGDQTASAGGPPTSSAPNMPDFLVTYEAANTGNAATLTSATTSVRSGANATALATRRVNGASARELPRTGLDLLWPVAMGLAALLIGLMLTSRRGIRASAGS